MTEKLPFPVAEFERQFKAATRRGARRLKTGPLATGVRYDRRSASIVISLNTGCRLTVPARILQSVAHASEADRAQVAIAGAGTAIDFPSLDETFELSALLKGVVGFPGWMQQLDGNKQAAILPTVAVTTPRSGRRAAVPRHPAARKRRAQSSVAAQKQP